MEEENLYDEVVITIDESFSVLKAIQILRKVYKCDNQGKKIGIFFKFTLFQLKDDDGKPVCDHVGWFFFHLLVLGYIEDDATGYSFSLLKGVDWKIYIEAPPCTEDLDSTNDFFELVPILDYVAAPVSVIDRFDIDDRVQLVCKYLHSHSMKPSDSLKATPRKRKSRKNILPKLSLRDDFSPEECYEIMYKHMPEQQGFRSIYTTLLFVQYMYRKCEFLDNLPSISGSTAWRDLLMDIILSAVKAIMISNTCSSCSTESWSSLIKYQIICDQHKLEDDNSVHIMCTYLDDIIEKIDQIKNMDSSSGNFKIVTPKLNQIQSREYSLECLSIAFGINLEDINHLMEESQYVLTSDYAMKMLNINECMECKLPVIICGETGVGKTFLIEMISKLWNLYIKKEIEKNQCFLMNSIKRTDHSLWNKTAEKFQDSKYIDEKELISILKDLDLTKLEKLILDELSLNPLWFLLDMPFSLEECKRKLKDNLPFSIEDVGKLIFSLLTCIPKKTFYKLSVHSAFTPDSIDHFFEDIILLSKEVSDSSAALNCDRNVPSVVVLIDEINTSSCGGCLKEIVADKTFHGVELPKNLFVIATCNPHRGNSLLLESDIAEISWTRGTYFVQDLHPTLKLLMWNFGSLSESEESDYVYSKLNMVLGDEKNSTTTSRFTQYITLSQQLIRKYTASYIFDHSKEKVSPGYAEECAKSSVSQRDIQRVFVFYFWLMKVYKLRNNLDDLEHRAILVSLGLVYYLRLNSEYRKQYASEIDKCDSLRKGVSFSRAFEDDIEWLISNLIIPNGIAKTRALKENLFAIIVCSCNKVPLIVVGKPGTSKTLSFNLANDNLKGIDSHNDLLKNTELFPALDPILYQCSKQTTSYEIDTLFNRAVKRQETYSGGITCVVFMDEAGLPEERHESLKILHHHLDEHKVAFVGVSNHVLDAAKTNRAVSLVIPDSTEEDLHVLVKGCYDNDCITSKVCKYCPAYLNVIQDRRWMNIFGMRDFIHFIHYLYQKKQELTPTLVLQALERNFNGTSDFKDICRTFFNHDQEFDCDESSIRNTFDILHESIQDKCDLANGYVRYKLIIDASEDDSVISFFFKYGILNEQRTHIFISSKLFAEKELQKVNTISAICHSVSKGHTVVMYQTEEIHECFYDLFNLRFRCIKDSSGSRYYANVAIGGHIKPIRVHSDFQCIVVLKQSNFDSVPTPFLNRFEKYRIDHKVILLSLLKKFPKGVQNIVGITIQQIQDFIDTIDGSATLYGFRDLTIYSLILLILPSKLNVFHRSEISHCDAELFHENKELFFHVEVLKALNQIGIDLIQFNPSVEELEDDASNIFKLLKQNATFSELYQNLTSPTTVGEYIKFAVDVLMSSDEHYPIKIVAGVHLVLSYVIQLIIRSLCKCLMQVMTPEGLIIVRKCIPSSYLYSYIYYQDHFCLKGIIEHKMDRLPMESVYGSKANVLVNQQKLQKFVVFCRSSAVVHSLPSNYPSLGNEETKLSHIISDAACLSIIKVNVIHSQNTFKSEVSIFYRDDTLRVLLLVIDMQESSSEVINHLRMIVEEAQPIDCKLTKHVVLLLHFPSSMFSSGYYPTLFLHGWKYRYIDSLAKSGDFDMEFLIKSCLFKNVDSSTNQVYDYESLLSILRHSAENVSPLLIAEFKSNKHISETDIKCVLTDEDIIALICQRFLHYLDAGRCLQYLDDAAQAVYERESTINMRSHIEVRIKNNMFKNFLIYVITFFHVHGVTNALLTQNNLDALLESFIRSLLPFIPVPDMFKLTNGSSYYSQSMVFTECSYKCPFFLLIYDDIEKIMDESIQVVCDNDAQFQYRKTVLSLTPLRKRKMELFFMTIRRMQQEMETSESFFVKAISKMDENVIWPRYFHDFVYDKLSIRMKTSGFLYELMLAILLEDGTQERRSYFNDSGKELCSEFRVPYLIVSLHFQFQIKRSFMKIHSTIFKLLNEIDIQHCDKWLTLDETTPIELMKNSTKLCHYILDMLFNFLSQPFDTITVNHLKVWNSMYENMISDTKLVQKLYEIPSSCNDQAVLIERKWNIMHAMHSVLCSCPLKDHFKATTIILRCHSCFIKMLHAQQIMGLDSSQLSSIHNILSDALEGDNYLIRNTIYDKLFEHFFSKSRSSYNLKDIECFLKIINEFYNVDVTRSMSAYYLRRLLQYDKRKSFYGMVRKEIGHRVARCYFSPSPIPKVLLTKKCNEELLNIPVGYLYCVLHMEELLSTDRNIVTLLDHQKKLKEEFNKPSCLKFEKVLLNIESQATIQVILRTIAERLRGNEKPKIYSVMQQLTNDYDEITALLEDNEEYIDTLIMHMLEQNRSFKTFKQNYSILCEEVKIRSRRSGSLTFETTNFSPFISLVYESSKSKRYFSDLKNIMVGIAESRSNDCCSQELTKLTTLKSKSSKLRLKVGIQGEPLFIMTLWLCAFEEFCENDKTSGFLLDKLKSIIDGNVWLLLRTLLNPKKTNEATFLFQLLHPKDRNKEDEMYKAMRRNLIVTIAVILGLQPKSNNLWFHLFEPLKLKNSFIPGFLSDKCIMEDMPYSLGCQLSKDGLYRNYDQYIASKNRNLLPQHAYMILWMNMCSLSMCYFSEQVNGEEMRDVIGRNLTINFFFDQQLNVLWNSMQKYYSLLHEEIDFLLVTVMQKFLEQSTCNDDVVFMDSESRNKYEILMVHNIIKPGIAIFMDKSPFLSIPEVCESRRIESDHIRFLAITDVQYIAASLAETFASDFLFSFNVLNIITESLHILVEFYEFIHKELSYRITKDIAEELSIEKLLHQLNEHFSSEEVKHFKQMFKNYMEYSKKFIEVTGDERSNRFVLNENSKVISLLSTDHEKGDCLFNMISTMIDYYNKILTNLCISLKVKLVDAPYHEVQRASSLEMEDLVQRCSLTIKKVRRHPFSIEWSKDCIDHSQLQSDIRENCVKGKYHIMYNARNSFKFRSSTAIHIDNIILEVDTIHCNLPPTLRVDLSDALACKLRKQFHSTEFAMLKDILSGLLVIARNLSVDSYNVRLTKLYCIKDYVRDFLGDDVCTSLSHTSFGIAKFLRCDFNDDQLCCLEDIEIGMLLSVIKYFCTWIKEGYSDFWDIDFCFKYPLDSDVDRELNEIIYCEHYKDQPKELLKDITKLESAVINLRSFLMQRPGEYEEPLVDLLRPHIEKCKLLNYVPTSIFPKHYVYFHITIRKLISTTKKLITIERKGTDESPRVWNEWIKNPWKGMYTVQYDEPLVVTEDYMTDADIYASLTQIHEVDGDIQSVSSSAGSVPMEHEHLSEFEFSDTESNAEPEFMKMSLEEYTETDLSDLFMYIGMEKYVELIKNGAIVNGSDISEMNVNDLKEAGVDSYLDQLKIYMCVSNLKSGRKDLRRLQMTPVIKFLHSMLDFKKYISSFQNNGVNGEILLQCTIRILNEIGVESVLDASRIIVYFQKYFGGNIYDHEESKQKLLSGIDSLSIQGKDEYMRKITEHDVSLSMLQMGGKELLIEMGIEKSKVQVILRQLKRL